MNTPLSWISEMVDGIPTPKEYMDAMTLSGTKVESAVYFDKNLEKIIVGKINKIEKHPDADKLLICKVQINKNGDEIQIVTGASNVFEGAVVPVVLDGGRVACDHSGNKPETGFEIKKGELRGVESIGMMCSIGELGRDKNYYPIAEDGIYIFNKEGKTPEIGSDALIALGLHDTLVEYEVTSNRVDCFSIEGIAREVAATFRKEFKPPHIDKIDIKKLENFDVEIKDDKLCKRYIAREIKNVKIAPSPIWLQRRLSAVGIRPINNIVDITNYVMVELGQPMHAFDLSKLGKKITIERAINGEKFTTLDGVERELDDSILLIKDEAKSLAIAGIMGGLESGITSETTDVLLEAATFDGTNIRLSSKKLGLRTESSGKFEKGLDPNNAIRAMDRACTLIKELEIGEIAGTIDLYPNVIKDKTVAFDLALCNKLLGTSITKEETKEYFRRLELKINDDFKSVIVPSFRQDLNCNADFAEELARFYGYDKIPTTLPAVATLGRITFKMEVEEKARDIATKFGFCEGMTFSFESPTVFDKLCIDKNADERNAIKIMNPLGEDYSIMRTSLVNGILTSLGTNSSRKNKNVRLYELANIYLGKLPLSDYPDERKQLIMGMYGDGDFFDLKGIIEEFLKKVGIDTATYVRSNKSFLHPGRQADIFCSGEVIGYLGEVHPTVQKNYSIRERVYLADIDLEKVCEKASFIVKYEGIAKFPSVNRDISLLMNKNILAGDIEKVIKENSSNILENLELFDIYEGDKIDNDKKSLAYSLTFRNKEKTLEESEITNVMNNILSELEKVGAVLRDI